MEGAMVANKEVMRSRGGAIAKGKGVEVVVAVEREGMRSQGWVVGEREGRWIKSGGGGGGGGVEVAVVEGKGVDAAVAV